MVRPTSVFEEIANYYETRGGEAYTIGEAVTQLAHACQCAYFADKAGYDEPTVVAALLHDIGHIMDDSLPKMSGNLGIKDHEILGGDKLKSLGFPDKTCEIVRRHVDAKRYLCFIDPSYYDKLSEASKGTLKQQGGIMTSEESKLFENSDPLFDTIIAMRSWDEKAKIENPDFFVPDFHSYKNMIERVLSKEEARKKTDMKEFKHYTLSEEQKLSWERNGFLLFKDILSKSDVENIVQWCSDIQNWEPTKGKWMVYYEKSNITGEEMLCRTENFLPYHQHLRSLLTKESAIVDVLEQLFGESPVLFKEKFNYKQAGGGAFPPHQDAPAFNTFGQKSHLSLSVAIDAATPENGCLQVSPGQHMKGLFPQAHHGGLTPEEESKLNWDDVEMEPGDVLIFSSWLPHRSGPNNTDKSRRVLYVTYNGTSDGDFREDYYKDKFLNYPQKVDRLEGKDYSVGAKTYNLATPITN